MNIAWRYPCCAIKPVACEGERPENWRKLLEMKLFVLFTVCARMPNSPPVGTRLKNTSPRKTEIPG
jgi:hypothetical protein